MYSNYKGIIFDLDMTLVNSNSLSQMRKDKKWPDVYKNIVNLKKDKYIDEYIKELQKNEIKIAVVTHSPESYCQKILNFMNWDIKYSVCYHEFKPNLKPHPKSYELALSKINLKKDEVISIGDSKNDIIASKNAGIKSIGAAWWINDDSELQSAKPEIILYDTSELLNKLKLW